MQLNFTSLTANKATFASISDHIHYRIYKDIVFNPGRNEKCLSEEIVHNRDWRLYASFAHLEVTDFVNQCCEKLKQDITEAAVIKCGTEGAEGISKGHQNHWVGIVELANFFKW